MISLERVFADYDYALLQIIASLWGVELSASNRRQAARQLAAQVLAAGQAEAMMAALPAESRAAFDFACQKKRVPLAQFTRQHGELRSMGPARRDREQPWRNAPSPAETIWYRGLIARAFFDSASGPQEYIFIPGDLLACLASETPPSSPVQMPEPAADKGGRSDRNRPAPAGLHPGLDLLPDDLTTLLAYTQIAEVRLDERRQLPARHRAALTPHLRLPDALDLSTCLMLDLRLAAGRPLKIDPAQARPYLERSRPQQQEAAAQAWRDSRTWNDLRRLPGLEFEGKDWHNDPVQTRRVIQERLASLPAGEWHSMESFVVRIKEQQPDFQRPAGSYSAWYIRDAATGQYLRGFEHWDRVEGALIRWLIQRPLCWLGLVDLAEDSAAFRINASGAAFLLGAPWPAPGPAAEAPLEIGVEGTLRMPAAGSRYDRFQAARVSRWIGLEDDDYAYRLTPSSIARAAQRGIKISQILAFLKKAAGGRAAPPALANALNRCARSGQEAVVAEAVVLKLSSPGLLQRLQRTPQVKRYLGEPLGPSAITIQREALPRLREALAALGILLE